MHHTKLQLRYMMFLAKLLVSSCDSHSMWHTGCVVFLDSRFCVQQCIVELCKKGVFTAAQIKKQHYWPKKIPGEAIVLHFATKDVGHFDAL